MYLLIVLDKDDNIVAQIPADHKTDKELLRKTKLQYPDCVYKFGNIVTQEQFEETKQLLNRIFNDYPDLGKSFVKDYPEMIRLGYEINDDMKHKKGEKIK